MAAIQSSSLAWRRLSSWVVHAQPVQAAVGADPDQIESFRAFCSLGCQVVLVLGDDRRDLADLAPGLHAITEFQ